MKLYAYVAPEIAKHAGFLKIGETNGSVEERVKQQGRELDIEKNVVWQDAVITGRTSIDKRLRHFLKEQGFQVRQFGTGHDTEWVKCTVGDIEKAFAIIKEQLYQSEIARQAVSNEFYIKIRNWYYWTTGTNSKIDSEYALRLVVRLLFCYFLCEKGLISNELFDERFLQNHLKEDEENGYYNAVLRNLFFHCLNTPMAERLSIKTKIEHENQIKNVKGIKELFAKIPFLNGGLFNEHDEDDIPLNDDYFFSKKRERQIPELGGKHDVWGIVRILSQYEYKLSLDDLLDHADYVQTIDPEFIGKVFESLLACIDADSKETRRKVTGSYYTPREIVDYMVDESLKAYLQDHDDLLQCKILDPACGSGAFPCGIMNEIMRQLDPHRTLTALERYRRKLKIIQEVIYGVDIQPIAVQITQLRLFLSLIQEIVPDKRKDNYGIEPLPNLETKFVCADTLMGLQKKEKNGQGTLEFPKIREKITQLQRTRNEYFMARTIREKEAYQREDESLRKMLGILMEEAGALTHSTAEKLVAWNPYDPSHSAPFFDPVWMFGVEKFDIVIGNPPYGARYSVSNKKYFQKNYETAQTIKNTQKGSLDTFTLFIEKGHLLCKQPGILHYIVPISITSSDSVTGVHRLLEKSCSLIKVSSYAVRPQPVFESAVVNTSILFFKKDGEQNEQILATKMYRKSKNFNLQHLLNNLQFIDVKDVKLIGRYPKISLDIEKQILKKILSQPLKIKNIVQKSGSPIFYRTTGGRYFKIITNYSTGSTKEKSICFNPKNRDIVGAILSSNLYFWFYQIFSNNLDLKTYEIISFGMPNLDFDAKTVSKIQKLYDMYLKDIERNASVRQTERYANIETFKEYKIGKSKHHIDRIDDIICPLYGLTPEEIDFIKNYEIDFRLSENG